jgi:hypothetical protein
MKWLLKYTVLVFSVLLFAVIFAYSFGRQQPPSQRVLDWHLLDCTAPCWAGIRPKVTTVAEAHHQLEKLLAQFDIQLDALTETSCYGACVVGLAEPRGGIWYFAETEFIQGVTFLRGRSDPKMPTLGDVLSTYGEPMCVSPSSDLFMRSDTLMHIHYNNVSGATILSIHIYAPDFHLQQPISGISPEKHGDLNRCEDELATSWRGLMSPRSYLNIIMKKMYGFLSECLRL